MDLGEFLNENGETIIDEEEYEFISKLQELKGNYRNDFEQWKSLKSEINYCQNLVNQCQSRLLQGKDFMTSLTFSSSFADLEFDIWYNECYLNNNTTAPPGPNDEHLPPTRSNADYQFYDDAAERFERMQKELLLSSLDSMPFRQAQMRTNRRVSPSRRTPSNRLTRLSLARLHRRDQPGLVETRSRQHGDHSCRSRLWRKFRARPTVLPGHFHDQPTDETDGSLGVLLSLLAGMGVCDQRKDFRTFLYSSPINFRFAF